MAAVPTFLSHSNSSSVTWDGGPLSIPPVVPRCHIAGTPTSQTRYFAADSRQVKVRKSRKRLNGMPRASPMKDSTRKVLPKEEQQGSNFGPERPFGSAQDTDDRQTLIEEDERGADVVRHLDREGGQAMSFEANEEEKRDSSTSTEGGELISDDTALKGSLAAGSFLVVVLGGFGAASYLYKDQINDLLLQFSDFLEGYGTAGYAMFVAVYAGLEILALPAIPLTMSAGLLFGTATGTIIVSISGTIAATASFLIARYLARDRILKLAKGNKKFLAIDKAIGENGFKVVTLLRLSPLLPFSLGNYLYGLTSVQLVPYILGSWLGFLPGTWAYVSAGAVGRAILQQDAEGQTGGSQHLLTLGLGLLVTVLGASYVTRLAKDAIKDIE